MELYARVARQAASRVIDATGGAAMDAKLAGSSEQRHDQYCWLLSRSGTGGPRSTAGAYLVDAVAGLPPFRVSSCWLCLVASKLT